MQGKPRLVLLLALGLLAAPAHAAAEEGDVAARVHFESGVFYFDRGEYEDAAREFSAAYELSQRHALLYNLYLAYERLGWAQEAADALEGYLTKADEVTDRERLETRLEALRRRATREAPREDAEPVPQAPPGADAPQAPPAPGGMPTPALISFGVAGAGLSVFAVAGGLTLAEDRSLADRCGANAGRSCAGEDLFKLSRRAAIADVGIAVAAAGTVAGLVLYFVLRDRDGGERATSVKVRPAGGGLAVHF